VRHGYGTGAGDLGFGKTDWAVMINAPGEAAAAAAVRQIMPVYTSALLSSNVLPAARL
jgi:hypothetical protein